MLYLLLFLAAFGCWLALRIRRMLHAINADMARRLERIEEQQRKTFEFICDAVNEFAIISGETKPEDYNRERLSTRIQAYRRSISKWAEDIAEARNS